MFLLETDKETIGNLLDLAYADQEGWFNCGDPALDFRGDPESAEIQAATYRKYGDLGERLGFNGEQERWNRLADSLRGLFPEQKEGEHV